MKMLSPLFFSRPTLRVAEDLLGKNLVRRVGRKTVIIGKIVETEAYIGQSDLACHASRGRTRRTEGLYGPPGTLYVYLVYGMYWCLNIVTEGRDFPSAVLIRAVEPVKGIKEMMRRRGTKDTRKLASGPGKLSQAFGITGRMQGKFMERDTVWIEDGEGRLSRNAIARSPRIGVAYAKHCARYPWRFFIKGNAYVSK